MYGGQHRPSQSIHREVLLSLRFILGQRRKSRKLAYKLAFSKLRPSERDKAFDILLQGKIDHILYAQPLSSTSRTEEERPVDQDFLSPLSDMPLLGERLLEIQRWNATQRPTKTRNMIRDKRDPARWYTLWVVLLVGGLSVVISALQLTVGVAQLVYAT